MLIKHQRTHQRGLGPFMCSSCDEMFKFKSGLDHHNRLKHTTKLSTEKELKTESQIQYLCSFCKKIYKSKSFLERHEEKCQLPNSSKDINLKQHHYHFYSCSYCLKQYKSKSNFEIHIASHEKGNEMEDYEYLHVEEETLLEAIYDSENDNKDQDMNSADELSEDFLNNIDENLVTVVKIETERFVPDEENIRSMETPDFGPPCIYESEDVEDYIIEQNDEVDFFETIIAEEFEPSSSLSDNDIIEQDHDFIFSESIEDRNKGEFMSDENSKVEIAGKETFKIQRTKKGKLGSLNESICDTCGATLKNTSHLKRHIQRKHQKDSHNLSCTICNSKFLLSYDLKRHMIK